MTHHGPYPAQTARAAVPFAGLRAARWNRTTTTYPAVSARHPLVVRLIMRRLLHLRCDPTNPKHTAGNHGRSYDPLCRSIRAKYTYPRRRDDPGGSPQNAHTFPGPRTVDHTVPATTSRGLTECPTEPRNEDRRRPSAYRPVEHPLRSPKFPLREPSTRDGHRKRKLAAASTSNPHWGSTSIGVSSRGLCARVDAGNDSAAAVRNDSAYRRGEPETRRPPPRLVPRPGKHSLARACSPLRPYYRAETASPRCPDAQ